MKRFDGEVVFLQTKLDVILIARTKVYKNKITCFRGAGSHLYKSLSSRRPNAPCDPGSPVRSRTLLYPSSGPWNLRKIAAPLATFGTSRTSSGWPSGCFVFETPLAASSGGGGLLTLPTWIPARTSGTDTGTDESVPAPLPSNWDGPCEQNTYPSI